MEAAIRLEHSTACPSQPSRSSGYLDIVCERAVYGVPEVYDTDTVTESPVARRRR